MCDMRIWKGSEVCTTENVSECKSSSPAIIFVTTKFHSTVFCKS